MPTFRFCESCKQNFEEELEIHQLNCPRSKNINNQSDTMEQSTNCLRETSEWKFRSTVLSSEELNAHQEKCKGLKTKCERCDSLVEQCKVSALTEKHDIIVSRKCYYCDMEMTEEELNTHSSICDFSLIRCEKCQIRIARRYLAHHLSVDCIKRMIQCEYCNYDLVADTLQEHFEGCSLIPVYCEKKCGEQVRRKELQHHMEEECPKRIIECKYCANSIEAELLEYHSSMCEKFPVSCPQNCGQSFAREELEKHLDETCEKSYAKCMYRAASCPFEGFPVDLRKHMEEKIHFHAEVSKKEIENLSMIVKSQSSKVIELEGKLKTEELLKTELKKAEDKVNELEELLKTELKKAEDKVNELEENLKVMKEAEEQKCMITGRYLWRIKDLPGNLESFNSDIQLRSDTFYESENGYKLRIMLRPNDSFDYRKCMSIFIRFCSGKLDYIRLKEPFEKRVTFTLIDQKDRKNDVSYSFKGFEHRCLLNLNCKEKCGYGTNQFITLEKMKSGNYICDNVMFIEVRID